MANTKSALKRVRQTRARTEMNQSLKTSVKSAKKSALAALESGDASAISTALRRLFSKVDRAVKNGVLHKNASRRIKRVFSKRSTAS